MARAVALELFHCVSARSLRPLWLLEELGLPYRLVVLPFPPRVHAKQFLASNPLGTVPLLREGSMQLSESVAMLEYILARHAPHSRMAVGAAEPAFGSYVNLLHHGEATLTVPQTMVLRYRFHEPPERRSPQVADDYERWFGARLRLVDSILSRAQAEAVGDDERYLCGRFTAADISVGYALLLARRVGLDGRFSPALRTYVDVLQKRPGLQRALAVEHREAIAQGVDPEPAGTAPVREGAVRR